MASIAIRPGKQLLLDLYKATTKTGTARQSELVRRTYACPRSASFAIRRPPARGSQ